MSNNNEDGWGGCAIVFLFIAVIRLFFKWIAGLWTSFILWLGKAIETIMEFLGYVFVFTLIFIALSVIVALLFSIPDWLDKRAYRKSTLGQLEHSQSVAEQRIRDAQNHQKSLCNAAVEMTRISREWCEKVDAKTYEPRTNQAMIDFADQLRQRGEKLTAKAKNLDQIINGYEIKRNSLEAHIGMYKDAEKDTGWAEIEAESAAMLTDFYDYCALHEVLISDADEEIIARLEAGDGNSTFELRMKRLEQRSEDMKLPPLELDDDMEGFLNQQTT